jgi:hypothetical protein
MAGYVCIHGNVIARNLFRLIRREAIAEIVDLGELTLQEEQRDGSLPYLVLLSRTTYDQPRRAIWVDCRRGSVLGRHWHGCLAHRFLLAWLIRSRRRRRRLARPFEQLVGIDSMVRATIETDAPGFNVRSGASMPGHCRRFGLPDFRLGRVVN